MRGILLLLALLSAVALGQWVEQSEEFIKKLEVDTFEPKLAEQELAVVEFYGHECFLCQGLHPIFDEAAQQLTPEGVIFSRLHCDGHEEFCGRFLVGNDWPQLHIYRRGVHEGRLNGSMHVAREIYDQVRNMQGPLFTRITTRDDLTAFMAKYPLTIVGGFELDEDDMMDGFLAVAKKLRERVKFVVISGEYMNGYFGSPVTPYYRLHNRVTDETIEYEGPMAIGHMQRFVDIMTLIPFADVNHQSVHKPLSVGLPMAMLFYKSKSLDKTRKRLKAEIVPALRTKFTFSAFNASAASDDRALRTYQLTMDDLPAVVIEDPIGGRSYHCQGRGINFTPERLKHCLRAFMQSALTPITRSQENEAALKYNMLRLNAGNFPDFVLSRERDRPIMILFYSRYDALISAAMPSYGRLAVAFREHQGIMFATYDIDENDVPPSLVISASPALVFYPSGDNLPVWLFRPDVNGGFPTIDDLLMLVKDVVKVPFLEKNLYFPDGKYGENAKENKAKREAIRRAQEAMEKQAQELERLAKEGQVQDDDDEEEVDASASSVKDEL